MQHTKYFCNTTLKNGFYIDVQPLSDETILGHFLIGKKVIKQRLIYDELIGVNLHLVADPQIA